MHPVSPSSTSQFSDSSADSEPQTSRRSSLSQGYSHPRRYNPLGARNRNPKGNVGRSDTGRGRRNKHRSGNALSTSRQEEASWDALDQEPIYEFGFAVSSDGVPYAFPQIVGAGNGAKTSLKPSTVCSSQLQLLSPPLSQIQPSDEVVKETVELVSGFFCLCETGKKHVEKSLGLTRSCERGLLQKDADDKENDGGARAPEAGLQARS